MSLVSIASRRRFLAALLTLSLAALGTGSFARLEAASGGADLSGRWPSGSWESATTSHKGRLSGVIRRTADGYRCTFCGTFLKVVPFRYAVDLQVTGHSHGRTHFRAQKDLPLFGGSFTCCGSATCDSFYAKYNSPEDHGVFRMSR